MKGGGKDMNLAWYLLILVTVSLWGMSFLWSDRVLDKDVPVFTFIFTRMILAAGALSVFSLLAGRHSGALSLHSINATPSPPRCSSMPIS